MKDAPCDCRSRRLVGDFLHRPCFAATPGQIACALGGSVNPGAFILVTLTAFPPRRCGPHACLLSIVRIPRPHFTAAADRHSATRRRYALDRPPRPIRKTGPPDGWLDSAVAENTPGNKLSCSVLNLFPSRTHIFVLGNCLSSSTAPPPSEHTPLRRRCCSEPFFDFHGHSTEADRPRPIASFLKEARFPQAGLLLFQHAGATRTFGVFCSG
jgi:hypothetical protein